MSDLSKYKKKSSPLFTDEVEFDVVEYVSDLILEYEKHTQVIEPIYIPTKGRAGCAHTPKTLDNENIPYKLFVEPQDYEEYSKHYESDTLVNIEADNRGISYVRNFIKKYSTLKGDKSHWQMDDDIRKFKIRMNGKNSVVKPVHALSIVEKTNNLFSNIGIAGLTSPAFAFSKKDPVIVNQLAYSCVLINNQVDIEWPENLSGVEDWHYTLTLLENKWCTLSFSHILFEAPVTATQKGGNMKHWESKEKRRKLYEKFVKVWPDNFRVIELMESSSKGYKLQHKRRFFNDYKNLKVSLQSDQIVV